jgi:hypothetical protein
MNTELEEKKHLYTSEQKLAWFGYGEWVEEPDLYEFAYKNYKCIVIRIVSRDGPQEKHVFGGYLCGYVQVPTEHPYFGKDYDDMDIECHGDLTYSEGEGEVWLIGFDCAHSGDYCPSREFFNKTNPRMQEFRKKFPIPKELKGYGLFDPVYRNMQFCIDQCKSIVNQLIEVMNERTKTTKTR